MKPAARFGLLLLAGVFAAPLAGAAAEPKKAAGPAVPRDWLEGVGDGFGVAAVESDAYFAVLGHARTVPLPDQKQLAVELAKKHEQEFKSVPANRRIRFSPFADLVRNRDDRRGEPVTVHGYIRRLEEMDAGDNPYGLKKLYQCWLWTKDSGLTPYTIVVSELPPGLPKLRGERDSVDAVTVTGYFFKIWSYTAPNEEGRWASPLLLAQRLEYTPPKKTPPLLTGVQSAGLLIGGAVVVGVLIVTIVRQSHARREEQRRLRQDAQVAEALRAHEFDLP